MCLAWETLPTDSIRSILPNPIFFQKTKHWQQRSTKSQVIIFTKKYRSADGANGEGGEGSGAAGARPGVGVDEVAEQAALLSGVA